MVDFFLRDEDEKLAEGATHMDDIDLIVSPIDGKLVAVSQKKGRHCCWQCGGMFVESSSQLRGVEVKFGDGPRILLHAQCSGGKPDVSIYYSHLRGMQVRRFFARATKRLGDAAGKKIEQILTS